MRSHLRSLVDIRMKKNQCCKCLSLTCVMIIFDIVNSFSRRIVIFLVKKLKLSKRMASVPRRKEKKARKKQGSSCDRVSERSRRVQ